MRPGLWLRAVIAGVCTRHGLEKANVFGPGGVHRACGECVNEKRRVGLFDVEAVSAEVKRARGLR